MTTTAAREDFLAYLVLDVPGYSERVIRVFHPDGLPLCSLGVSPSGGVTGHHKIAEDVLKAGAAYVARFPDRPTPEALAAEIIAQRAEADGEETFAAEVRAGAWDHQNRGDIARTLAVLNAGGWIDGRALLGRS